MGTGHNGYMTLRLFCVHITYYDHKQFNNNTWLININIVKPQ